MNGHPRLAAAALATLAALHVLSFAGMGPVDDEFIFYRYAHHLLEGHGLVFNVGERVEGFSAPLWLFACAVGQLLGVSPSAWTIALGTAANALATCTLARAWSAWGSRPALPLPALLLAASPAFAWHAVAGLGTTTLALLLVLWLASASRAVNDGRPARAAALWMGLACLLRAEAVLLALPWVLFEARRTRRGWSALALLPLSAWTLFRLLYYGRLLPVTYAVKKLPLGVDLLYGADYLVLATLQTGFGLFLALAVIGALRARPGGLLRSATLGVLLHAAYVVYVGGDYMPLGRFFVPTLPLVLFGAGLELRPLLERRPRTAVLLSVLLVGALQAPQWRRPRLRESHRQNTERWIAIGRQLRSSLAPDTLVALAPVGAVGFYSELPIVDLLGVTNDHVPRVRPDLSIAMKGHHRHDGEWVLAQAPDVVILANGVTEPGPGGRPQLQILDWERDVWLSPLFQREYRAMVLDLEQSYPLVFFLRRGAAPPAGARPA